MPGDRTIASAAEPGTWKAGHWWLLGLITVAGAVIRLYRISAQIVLDDEWHALNAVQYFDIGWIFTHFSTADISIPLALLYELQYPLTGLSEVLMRWPMLVAGILAVPVLPHLFRHWLNRPERLLLAALIAISPFLIYYSRFARPYMLLAVLEPAALVLAWHWWKGGRAAHGAGWVVCAALSAWLNSPALAVVTAPFAWFGLLALRRIRMESGRGDLLRLLVIGIIMLAALAALLGPPLVTDFGSIAGKAGQHLVGWGTLAWSLSLASGSGHAWVFIPLGLLSALGFVQLYRRDAGFAGFLAAVLVLAMIAVSLVGAAWVQAGPVFLRYLIGFLPVFLACSAIGVVTAVKWLVQSARLPDMASSFLYLAFVLVLITAGPVPRWPVHDSQFVTHLDYHFHYDRERNEISAFLDSWYREEAFYWEIAELHPGGDAIVVESPWYLESFYNPLALRQEVHGQSVKVGFINGLCAGPLYGELRAGQPGMKFRNFVYLQDLLDGAAVADYLVLRRRSMSGEARIIEMDFDRCERAVRDALGEPWRESENALVFRIGRGP